jgi:hypothetical protein
MKNEEIQEEKSKSGVSRQGYLKKQTQFQNR